MMSKPFDRRRFLKNGMESLGVLCLGSTYSSMVSCAPFLQASNLKNLGPLGEPDENGLRLAQGFTGRELARSGHRVKRADGSKIDYRWHQFPDGGATFKTDDGGWIYVSNSEVQVPGCGGAGAIRFDQNGCVVDAYSILSGTTWNCAGGPTPWGTWLSCEEIENGYVYECDIYGNLEGKKVPGLGRFVHEAATIDFERRQVYLTEDREDGRFYRFTSEPGDSSGPMDLNNGILEVACVKGNKVTWLPVPNPTPGILSTATRYQVPESSPFNGGEGAWYHEGVVFFTTKGDNRVWAYDVTLETLSVRYDYLTAKTPMLKGVDNVMVTADGHILVAEDGGDMQIVILGPGGEIYPLVQVVGQDKSEITGPAINHLGNRLYFSSQRGNGMGITYEVAGNFLNL